MFPRFCSCFLKSAADFWRFTQTFKKRVERQLTTRLCVGLLSSFVSHCPAQWSFSLLFLSIGVDKSIVPAVITTSIVLLLLLLFCTQMPILDRVSYTVCRKRNEGITTPGCYVIVWFLLPFLSLPYRLLTGLCKGSSGPPTQQYHLHQHIRTVPQELGAMCECDLI